MPRYLETVAYDLDVHHLPKGQVAWRISVQAEEEVDGAAPRVVRAETAEGISAAAALTAWRKDRKGLPKPSSWKLMKPEHLELLRTRGFLPDATEFDRSEYVWDQVTSTPYSALRAADAGELVAVRVDSASHRVYDADGLPLPVAITFDGPSWGMNSRLLDVDAAVRVLRGRSDLTPLDHRGRATQELAVVEPDWASDDEEPRVIPARWAPDVGTYRRLCELADRIHKQGHLYSYEMGVAFQHLDPFGIAHCRTAPLPEEPRISGLVAPPQAPKRSR